MVDHNWDTLGIKEPRPRQLGFKPADFQDAIEWVKRFVFKKRTRLVVEAKYMPELSRWAFYDDSGEFVINVDHDLVERVKVALEAASWNEEVKDVKPLTPKKDPLAEIEADFKAPMVRIYDEDDLEDYEKDYGDD